ncbi:MAG: PPOX class F420-dependent oxidoreductase [Acidimicrobiaceae bacterium]
MNDNCSAQVLKSAKYVSLITFRKSGEPVRSPVWFAQFGDNPNSYGVITETNAGKVKRIRANSKIEVQVCDAKGGIEPDAQKFSGVAHLVTGAEAVAVRKAISRRYGLTYKLFSIYYSVSSLFKKKDELPETNIVFKLTN